MILIHTHTRYLTRGLHGLDYNLYLENKNCDKYNHIYFIDL